MKMDQGLNIRPSPIAGRWYEGDPEKLARVIDGYMSQKKKWLGKGKVFGLIVPHAGHIYSGAVAGTAFATIQGLQPNKIVVLSPLHQANPSPFLTTAHDYYQTPLGTIKVDKVCLEKVNSILLDQVGVGLKYLSNDAEHSLEIELPFLQRCIKTPYELIPIMVREYDMIHLKILGEAIASVLKDETCLVIASTDLSHFYADETARKLDIAMLNAIASDSPEKVMRVAANGEGEACGLGAIIAAMFATRSMGANAIDIIDYQNSSLVTGDTTSVVGYGAAVIFNRG
jgi:AmmeMemoRadiSam system protein B